MTPSRPGLHVKFDPGGRVVEVTTSWVRLKRRGILKSVHRLDDGVDSLPLTSLGNAGRTLWRLADICNQVMRTEGSYVRVVGVPCVTQVEPG